MKRNFDIQIHRQTLNIEYEWKSCTIEIVIAMD